MIECLAEIGMKDGGQLVVVAGLVAVALIVGFGALALAKHLRARRLQRENRGFRTAINHMNQGLCVWDADTKLLLCNERYVEMYGMSPAIIKPGVSLREVLDHRAARGQFKGNADEYLDEVRKRIARGKATDTSCICQMVARWRSPSG